MPKLHKVRSEGIAQNAVARGRADAIIDLGTGRVVTGYTKGMWIPTDRSLLKVTGTLMSPGSTATIAQIYRNGVGYSSLTIGASATIASADSDVEFFSNDIWQMYITQAGANALGLTFFGTFS